MGEDHQLSDSQLGLLRILWGRGEATALEVHAVLAEGDLGLAPTTVSTMLSRLEKKGLLAHRTEGRQFIYRALVCEADVRRSMLGRVTDFFFGGDVPLLVSHLVEGRGVDPDDLARLQQCLAERSGEAEEHDDA
ncbi:BlaI/MecI/CopY family transcriptional regulator [Nannocystis bainbridge]|uniref:BlaI/MecI/CopY family transcriptional regulator n=1 Tax=Nannocystis bainbridge TaxID=2995303 RepID=A0ABT5DZ57_9BACT|nr:BlaI/MecI/CopY family transcriptional regulator [Nannocystis bainbridge]MDC0718890.1 BlaI/MecI/CopY family transcriptional regulator [Nannocystis bainbridge]